LVDVVDDAFMIAAIKLSECHVMVRARTFNKVIQKMYVLSY